MCGFFASSRKLSLPEINLVYKRLELRGPDDSRISSSKKGTYIFNRLACTGRDVNSMQPLNEDILENRNFFLFNGEIYNYLELNKKFSFNLKKNTSDTKVLSLLIKKKGFINSTKNLNGAYAIAYIEKDFKFSYLSKDIYGQKALFYANDKKNWYLSSDPYSIAYCANKDLSRDNLLSYLNSNEDFGTRGLFIPGHSFFKDIYSVRSGETVFLSSNKIKIIKKDYIFPKITKRPSNINLDIDKFNRTIDRVTRDYIGKNPDVCFEFSGGIDSTTLLLSSLKLKNKVKYFTKISKGIDNIAQRSIKKIKKLNVKNRVIKQDKKNYLFDTIRFIRFSGSPPRWGTAPAMMPLYKKMKEEKMKICISGGGADEFFYGYNNIQKILNTDFEKLRKMTNINLVKNYSFSGWINDKTIAFLNYKKQIVNLIKIYSKKNPDFRKNHFSICNFIRFIDLNIFLPEISSLHSDLVSMESSIELRSVFLDKKITNFATNALRHDFLLNNSSFQNNKIFLKKALSKRCRNLGLDPIEFVEKQKEGTRNFAIQAFKDKKLNKLPKETIRYLKIKKNGVISEKMKFKIFFIAIFHMIFKMKFSNEKIFKIIN